MIDKETLELFLFWRGIKKPCSVCGGRGVRGYGDTSTFMGGCGGQMMTQDICDHCWGSGDEDKHWVNLRLLPRKPEPLSIKDAFRIPSREDPDDHSLDYFNLQIQEKLRERGTAAMEEILSVLDSGKYSNSVVAETIEAIADSKQIQDEAFDAISKYLQHGSIEVRDAASLALVEINPTKARPLIEIAIKAETSCRFKGLLEQLLEECGRRESWPSGLRRLS